MKSLERELGVLSNGGISITLRMPVKIIWYNQTRTLRFFTPMDDDDRLNRYIETMIHRTFGADEAMKKQDMLSKYNAPHGSGVRCYL